MWSQLQGFRLQLFFLVCEEAGGSGLESNCCFWKGKACVRKSQCQGIIAIREREEEGGGESPSNVYAFLYQICFLVNILKCPA